MMNYIRYSSFLLVTMLLLSACRTAHSAAKEESTTQTAETAQSSVASESSFASLFSALSLRADSIVVWMLPSEADSAATLEEDSCFAPADTSLCSDSSGFTARSSGQSRPKRNTQQVAKILISGLNMNSVQNEQKVSSSLARDTISTRESRDSSLSEKEESKPPNNNLWSLIFAFLLIAGIVFFAIMGVRSVFKIK